MTTTYDIKFRQCSTGKKTNSGVIMSDGIRAKIGKNQKKSIIRRLNQGVDPRKFRIKKGKSMKDSNRNVTYVGGEMAMSMPIKIHLGGRSNLVSIDIAKKIRNELNEVLEENSIMDYPCKIVGQFYKESGDIRFWNDEFGWVGFENATIFEFADIESFPDEMTGVAILTNDGEIAYITDPRK